MRSTEIRLGIDVLNPEDEEVIGKSKAAARKAVF